MGVEDELRSAVEAARIDGWTFERFIDEARGLWADQCREEAKRVEEG